ncbi:MAG: hypothetical protein EPN56_03665 [Rhodanobacter sp.]|nr:MAG: hypothetical protein EPN78_08580 [Rhodanobacter sp.]TAM08750.1 MAG: hypothetical protein EPN66_11755 [Rhodanobacter sp.]TAM36792.1 MAG: hypothetical protein EPN56_03665 [Rhodanobacter sp.]
MRMQRYGWLLSFVALLAGFGLPAAHAEGAAPEVYTGTLGRQAIVLELTPGDNAVTAGRYFYVRHHRDIALSGKLGSDHLQLHEGWPDDTTGPRATLERQADGGWRGSWQDAKGKTLPITLQPAKVASPAADTPPWLKQLYASDRYGYLRLAGLKPQAGKRETFMGHTLQWWHVPAAGIVFLEILDGYPPAELARINQVLMGRMWEEAGSYYECLFNHFNDGNYDQTVTPRLLTANLVSVSVFTDYYCGGAHPDFGDAAINLDAHTAQPLALEDLLWVGKGKPLHYFTDADDNPAPGSASFEAWSDYRDHHLAPWLVRQWRQFYPKVLSSALSEDECEYDDPSAWQFVSWHMTPKGLFIGPSFARVARVCEANDHWSILPWHIVREHPGRLGVQLLPGS